jgi:hypothetical protein
MPLKSKNSRKIKLVVERIGDVGPMANYTLLSLVGRADVLLPGLTSADADKTFKVGDRINHTQLGRLCDFDRYEIIIHAPSR